MKKESKSKENSVDTEKTKVNLNDIKGTNKTVDVTLEETESLKKLEDQQSSLLKFLGSLEYEINFQKQKIIQQIFNISKQYSEILNQIKTKYKIGDSEKIVHVDFEKKQVITGTSPSIADLVKQGKK